MQVEQRNQVYQANDAFYNAFQELDIQAMEKVWAKAAYIQCIHPGWTLIRGWDAVMASWRRIFEDTKEMSFLLSDVQITVRGPVAWATLYENITSRIGSETVSATVLTTNIFEKSPGRWQLIHHHGSNVVRPPTQSNITVH